MVGFGDRGQFLRELLLQLGFLPFEVGSLVEAESAFSRGSPLSERVLLSISPPRPEWVSALDRLRALTPRLEPIAVGPPPDASTTTLLRSARIAIGLWTPFALEDLALVLALTSPIDGHADPDGLQRVPTRIDTTVTSGHAIAPATVRSLCATGLLLDTAAAIDRGQEIDVPLPLDGETLPLRARVVFATPGAQDGDARSVGARLLEAPEPARSRIAEFVVRRGDAFRV
jgi:hypothetical protein